MLKVGFSRLDVTPPLGSAIAGYFYHRYASGVLDPIELNAIAITNGKDTVVMVSADILGMVERYADPVRRNIAEKLGIRAENVIIAALHQHTSIGIFDGNPIMKDTAYTDLLFRKMVDAAVLAAADMKEAKMSYAEGETSEPISFVRRYFMKDGSIGTNPGRLNPDIVRPASEADNTVRLVRFAREGAKDIALVGFSTHPDVIGGDMLSADWPGFVRRFVEADHADAHCIFFNGTQGDTNHIDVNKPQREDSYAQARDMGRIVADTVAALWDKTAPVAGEEIAAEMTTVYTKTRTDGEERYDEMKAFYDDYEAGRLEKEPHITMLTTAKRIINIRTARIYVPVNITVISVGGVAFVGFGGEPFTQYSRNAAAATDKRVITICCANGYSGYLPTEAAFAEGGYEASSSMFSPNLESLVSDAVRELLSRI